MLTVLKKIFAAGGAPAAVSGEDDIRLSAALLLLEAMHADHEVTEEERGAIEKGLQGLFGVSAAEARALREAAERRFEEVTSMHHFVSILNSHFSEPQKIQVIETMWRIAHSDKVLDKYEDHIIRRVAELLHISHAHFIQAKHRAADNAV